MDYILDFRPEMRIFMWSEHLIWSRIRKDSVDQNAKVDGKHDSNS